ncbi:uncharacterized protein LOC135146044 [Zophobas morio]|jgi:HSP20 family protein|uniref:uncharacterized protein LOC135146044 n=1 Tax=Zophobas morio TaxID=2755281 RepID=UPI0030833EE4
MSLLRNFLPRDSTEFDGSTVFNFRQRDLFPRCNIQEDDNCYRIEADFPGVDKKNIHLELKNNVLTLSAKQEISNEDTEEKGITWHRRERFSGTYNRSFHLPENVKEEDIFANYDHGVLMIKIAKSKPESPKARKINID